MIKKTIKWVAVASVVTILISILAAYIFVRYEDKKAKKFLPAKDYISNDIKWRMIDSTVGLPGNLGHGRAYFLKDENIYITNYHVVNTLCANSPCEGVEVSVTLATQGMLSVNPVRLEVLQCTKWLDVCLLKDPKRATQLKNLPISTNNIEVGTRLFMIPLQEDEKKNDLNIATGTLTHQADLYLITNVPVRSGYSGSPLFDSSGKFVGIVSSTLSLKRLLESLGVEDSYFAAHSLVVPASTISKFLLCPLRNTKQNCHQEELQAFLEMAQNKLSSEALGRFQKALHLLFIRNFLAEFKPENADEEKQVKYLKDL